MKNNLIQLFPIKKNSDEFSTTYMSCTNCRNKAFKAIYENESEDFPELICTACGMHLGQIGFLEE